MRVFDRDQIAAALDEATVLDALRRAFISFAAGGAQVAAVGHLAFADPPGDCHIKSAHIAGEPMFVVKVGSSFYRNPERGLSSSQGSMSLYDAATGEMLGILNDGGFLTDARTALTGVLAAQAIARPGSRTLGIVGAGIQGRLQAQLIARHLGLTEVLVWARNGERAAALASDLDGEAVSLAALCDHADVIVTTTPSTEPLITADLVRPGTRIVAVGADSPGKRELDPQILARGRVVVDSPAQCMAHGETAWAVDAGLLAAGDLIELGELLSQPRAFADDEIVVADLTGVAVQDAAISASAWAALTAR